MRKGGYSLIRRKGFSLGAGKGYSLVPTALAGGKGKRKGYSLIELLVVVAIIGILGTLGTYAWNSSGKRSRDSIRKADLSRMKNALGQHYLSERAYPEFDNSQGNLYNAGWQLADGTACGHNTLEKVRFLTPTYLNDIPQDPKSKINPIKDSCGELATQSGEYLYLAGPRPNNAGYKSPRSFILMAALEASVNDQISDTDNPLISEIRDFEDYQTGLNQEPNFFNQNYLVKGSNGR